MSNWKSYFGPSIIALVRHKRNLIKALHHLVVAILLGEKEEAAPNLLGVPGQNRCWSLGSASPGWQVTKAPKLIKTDLSSCHKDNEALLYRLTFTVLFLHHILYAYFYIYVSKLNPPTLFLSISTFTCSILLFYIQDTVWHGTWERPNQYNTSRAHMKPSHSYSCWHDSMTYIYQIYHTYLLAAAEGEPSWRWCKAE